MVATIFSPASPLCIFSQSSKGKGKGVQELKENVSQPPPARQAKRVSRSTRRSLLSLDPSASTQQSAASFAMASTLLSLLDPYLPTTLLAPLHQVVSSLSSPTSLLPLLLSLLTLYAALSSLYHTTRLALRLAWFFAKWGALLAAVGATFSSWSNWGKEEKGLAGTAWSVGKRGVEWWGDQPVKRRKHRSASGRRRTWATANDDGEWDEPDEGKVAMEYVKERVLTFLGAGEGDQLGTKKAPGLRGKGKTLKKGEKVDKEKKGVDLGSMAMNFALGRARKVWDELAEGLGGTADEGRRR